jgi:hypothetical protein
LSKLCGTQSVMSTAFVLFFGRLRPPFSAGDTRYGLGPTMPIR